MATWGGAEEPSGFEAGAVPRAAETGSEASPSRSRATRGGDGGAKRAQSLRLRHRFTSSRNRREHAERDKGEVRRHRLNSKLGRAGKWKAVPRGPALPRLNDANRRKAGLEAELLQRTELAICRYRAHLNAMAAILARAGAF
jgi:hypothetical protein